MNTRSLMGLNGGEWQHLTDVLYSLAKNSGCKVQRFQITASWWTDNITGWWSGEKFQSKLIQIREWCRKYGIKFWLDCTGVIYNPPYGNGNAQARVIFNTNGAGDYWIAIWSQLIRALQPEIVGLMNEPGLISGASEYAGVTQAQYYTAYKQFCAKSITAYKAIKPDIIIAVCSLPFYDFTAVAEDPIPNVDMYEFHDYYAFDHNYPPWYEPGQQAYWDGNLAQAKTLQYNRWLGTDIHLQLMFDKGLPVIISESGSHNLNPNYLAFMQCFYDFAKDYNLGILQHDFRAWDPIYGFYESGILNSDNPGHDAPWSTLNELGQLWSRNMLGVLVQHKLSVTSHEEKTNATLNIPFTIIKR